MKIFKLDIVAFHKLECSRFVTIDKDGYFVRPHISRVRYRISLGKDGFWIYQKFADYRNKNRDFVLEKKSSHCLVRANFKQVCDFNYKKK